MHNSFILSYSYPILLKPDPNSSWCTMGMMYLLLNIIFGTFYATSLEIFVFEFLSLSPLVFSPRGVICYKPREVKYIF